MSLKDSGGCGTEYTEGYRKCRDRLVVRTLRCGRSNPGSNPGHGIFCVMLSPMFAIKIRRVREIISYNEFKYFDKHFLYRCNVQKLKDFEMIR